MLRLCEALGFGLGESNELLHAAGLPATCPKAAFDSDDLAPYGAAIEQLLRAHEPAARRAGVLHPETAQIPDTSDASVNSALQRARTALDSYRATGRLRDVARSPESLTERGLLEEFIAASHRRDIPALVSLLARDALLTMPPEPLAYRGAEAISSFLSRVPAGGDLTTIRLVSTRANGQPAVAAYLREGATALAYGIRVLTIEKDKIGEITGFSDPTLSPCSTWPTASIGRRPPRPTENANHWRTDGV